MGQGFCIHNLGLVDGESGDEEAAADRFEQARSIFRRIDCIKGESQTLYSLGQMHRRRGNYEVAKVLLEQALQVRRRVSFSRGESKALADLGRVLLHLGDERGAIEAGCQAVHIAERIGARSTHAYNLTQLGHIWTDLEHWEKAAQSYRFAISLRRELGQAHLLPEPLVGLAQAYLFGCEPDQAKALVSEVPDFTVLRPSSSGRVHEWGGVDSLNQLYATCHRVLSALHDPRAELVLKLPSD